MLRLPKSKLRSKGSTRIVGCVGLRGAFLVEIRVLAGRSCDRNVVRPFRACRFTLHPAANVAHSELFTGRVVDRPFCGVRNGVPNGSGVIAWSKL